MSGPSRQSAVARLRELCHHVEKLIELAPTVLPIVGRPDPSPWMTDFLRRPIVDELMAQMLIPEDEWDDLCRVLPEQTWTKLRLLARVIGDLRRRFKEEDEQDREENAALSLAYEDAVERGVENAKYRHIWEPERRIYPGELACLESYLALVTEAVGPGARERGKGDEEEFPKVNRGGEQPSVTLEDGVTYAVSLEGAAVVDILIRNSPRLITYRQMTTLDSILEHQNAEKIGRDIIDRLPEPIRVRIRREPGKGCSRA
jgi:hypothetical protein